jgi:hypothetical protein
MLIITLPSEKYRAKKADLLALVEKELPTSRIDSISENQTESVVSYSFIRLEKESLLRIQDRLNKISGQVTSNVFFNRSGEV